MCIRPNEISPLWADWILRLALGFKPQQKNQHEAKLVDLFGLSTLSSNGLFHFLLGSISHTHDVKANESAKACG